jgi:hypothetical protein
MTYILYPPQCCYLLLDPKRGHIKPVRQVANKKYHRPLNNPHRHRVHTIGETTMYDRFANKDRSLTVRITPLTYQALENILAERNSGKSEWERIKISDLVRYAILHYIERNQPTKPSDK